MSWEDDPTRPRFYGPEFIKRASGIGVDTKQVRYQIAKQIRLIHEKVKCMHGKPCSFHLAEAVLRARFTPGPIVECGCYKGGMTAKLSYVCEKIGKQLIVFDSFKGLPQDEQWEKEDGTIRHWKKGMFACPQEEVEANVREYGSIGVCEFVPGIFRDAIPAHSCRPALVYADTDSVTSAKQCLRHLWVRLQGDRYYTHDFGYPNFVSATCKEEWWQTHLGQPVPEYAVFTRDAKHLAYYKKPG